MARIFIAFSLCVMLAGGALTSIAQEKKEVKEVNGAPKITMVQPGADSLYADLNYVMSLTSDVEQKQLPVVKEYLDVFLVGLDRKRPMRIDLVLSDGPRRYIATFPVADAKLFRTKNLGDFNIVSRGRGVDYWKLSGAYDGYMRKVDDYMVFAEKSEEVEREKIGKPIAEVKPLLDKNYDLAAEMTSETAGQDLRRKRIQKERDEIIGALKQTKEETPDDFALRKKFFQTQFDEMERLYAETKHALLGANLDTKQTAKHADINLELNALPGTSLEATIKQLGEKPSRFAGISRNEKSILSLRLTHPLDEMRKANFSALFEMLAKVVKQDIDKDAELTAAQKEASRKIADMTAALFINTAKAGLADGFLEAHANASGKNTLVGAFQAPDAAKALDILKLLPQARPNQKIDFDVAQEGDVKIHKAVITGKQYEVYKNFFGSEEIFVGLSNDVVWFSTGENAQSELKAAIQKAATPGAAPKDAPFLDFFAKAGPWIELREKYNPNIGNVKFRKLAIDAFKAGDDTLSMQLNRKGEQITGALVAQPGILRFAGKTIADFSKDNLDDGGQKKNPGKQAAKPKNAAKNN